LSDQSEQSVEGSKQPTYLDWNNSIGIMDKAFEKGLFVTRHLKKDCLL